MGTMSRESVYAAIDGERVYQYEMARDESRPDMVAQLSVGETIVAMEHALGEARREWYSGSGNHEPAMNYLRKVTALGVQAGENYGMPHRKGY